MSLDSFPWEPLWSPVDQNFFQRGPAFFSDQIYQTLVDSLIRTLLYGCLLAEPTSLNKKQKKMKKIMSSIWSLIRPNCVRKLFWSDPSALEEVMIRPNCARICLWSDKSALEEVMIRPNCARSRPWLDPSVLESAYDQTFQTKSTSDQTISRPSSRL